MQAISNCNVGTGLSDQMREANPELSPDKCFELLKDRVPALWKDGKIVVNISNVRPSEVPFKIRHEALLHDGIRRAFGDEAANQLLDFVWDERGDSDAMRAILERYQMIRQKTDENGNYVFDEDGKAVYQELSQEDKRLAAEEFLAHLQETNGVPTGEIYAEHKVEIDDFAREHGMDIHDRSAQNIDRMTREWMAATGFRPPRPSWLKQLISRIRMWLHQHGFFVHHLTDDDILTILARSAKAEVAQRRGKSAQGNGTRYAVNNGTGARPYYDVPFAESVDAVINGTATGNGLVFVRETPEVLKAIGIPGLPIMITRQHIKDIYNLTAPDGRNAHNLGEQLKHLPDMLDKPVAIIAEPDEQAGRSKNRVVAITQYRDKHGNDIMIPVIIGVESSAAGAGRITVNVVASTYGKHSAAQMLQNAIDAEKRGEVAIFGANKKTTSKLHLPGTPIVPRGGFNVIHNINDPNSPVKGTFAKNQTETLQFQRWFKKSKVVDANGKPLIVYHGSPAEFTVFSYLFGPRNGSAEGRGFYFTGDKAKAEGYKGANGKLYEVYLRLRKPLDPDALTITKAEVEKIIRAIDPDGDYVSDYASDSSGYPGRAWYEKAVKDAANAIYDSSDNNADIIGEFFSVFGQGDALKKITEATGYDGFIKKDTYVVFAPEQIKSATDNVGTFDPNNPDVRYSIDEDGAGFVEPVPFTSTIDDSRGKNIVAMLRPIVGRNQANFDKEALARNIKERYGVDVSPVEALLWAREAALRRDRRTRAIRASAAPRAGGRSNRGLCELSVPRRRG